MNKRDIIVEAFTVGNNYEHLADNFQFTDSIGSPPTSKEAWIGMAQFMTAALPDLDFKIESIEEDGEDFLLTGSFTGTFTNDLDLTAMGMGMIPATGKVVTWPSNTSRVSFEGDKIVRNHNLSTGPDAGIGGFLAVLQG